METLKELCAKYYSDGWPDKDTVHSYIEVYNELLSPYIPTAKNILEIGLMSGQSLRMWDKYFKFSNVYGIDCSIKPIDGKADLTQAIKEGYNIIIADACNPEHIKKHFDGIKFDVIIEDANHDIEQQLNIFVTLKPYLNEGGIYIVEDIQDIDKHSYIFKSDPGWQVLDRRHIKNRYDDVLAIYRK